MTNKQKQWQLYFLGYLDRLKDIDGYWGPRSRAATLAFQQDFFEDSIAHDGIFGTSTEQKSREVIDAIQDVVTAYVAVPLVNDGLAGYKTMEALEAYQTSHGLPVTGIADKETRAMILWSDAPIHQERPDTGIFWDEIEYFTRKELKCKCGGRYCNGYPAEPKELLVRLADRARKHFGRAAHNISCLRCPIHNANSGGVANSQHMYGEAMDIRIDGVSADELLAFFLAQPEVRYAYKINSTNVHFDIPKGAR